MGASEKTLDQVMEIGAERPWFAAGQGTALVCTMCVTSKNDSKGNPCYLSVDLVKHDDRRIRRFLVNHYRCGFSEAPYYRLGA